MLIALILVSVYAYAITGYCFQKVEYCEDLDEKLIFGVLWPFWLVFHIYNFIYITIRVWRKRKKDKPDISANQHTS